MKYLGVSIACLGLVAAVVPATASAQTENWADRISFQGDFRLRYEGIDEQGETERTRARYRARLAATGKVSDTVKVVLEFATAADNPVSRNVTFDGGFSGENIGLDLAYVEWKATDALTVYGGKMKNPLYRAGGAPLVWDGDLNPEGVAVQYRNGAIFVNAGGFFVEERSSSSDSNLLAAQAGAKFALGDNASLTAGIGYFGYSHTVGNEPFWDGNPGGNSVDLAGNYLFDYKDTEVFAALDTKVGDLPLSVYAQYVQNRKVDQQDAAYALGAKLGSAAAPGHWEGSWTYMDVEADAVISTFFDSDFAGGQTDSKGHLIKADYRVSPAISLAATFFINELDRFAGNKHDYDRYQLDVQFSFK